MAQTVSSDAALRRTPYRIGAAVSEWRRAPEKKFQFRETPAFKTLKEKLRITQSTFHENDFVFLPEGTIAATQHDV